MDAERPIRGAGARYVRPTRGTQDRSGPRTTVCQRATSSVPSWQSCVSESRAGPAATAPEEPSHSQRRRPDSWTRKVPSRRGSGRPQREQAPSFSRGTTDRETLSGKHVQIRAACTVALPASECTQRRLYHVHTDKLELLLVTPVTLGKAQNES